MTETFENTLIHMMWYNLPSTDILMYVCISYFSRDVIALEFLEKLKNIKSSPLSSFKLLSVHYLWGPRFYFGEFPNNFLFYDFVGLGQNGFKINCFQPTSLQIL